MFSLNKYIAYNKYFILTIIWIVLNGIFIHKLFGIDTMPGFYLNLNIHPIC